MFARRLILKVLGVRADLRASCLSLGGRFVALALLRLLKDPVESVFRFPCVCSVRVYSYDAM